MVAGGSAIKPSRHPQSEQRPSASAIIIGPRRRSLVSVDIPGDLWEISWRLQYIRVYTGIYGSVSVVVNRVGCKPADKSITVNKEIAIVLFRVFIIGV